jgi:hypothetical protein
VQSPNIDHVLLVLSGHEFRLVGPLNPDRDDRGVPVEFMPQAAYAKADSTRLNPHGAGPFCRLRIAGGWHEAGVYAVVVGDGVRYIGICDDLSERWGPRGYGAIHPRNCYIGGQPTNCKINAAILREVKSGAEPALFFAAIGDDRRLAEAQLIRDLIPPWNGRVVLG